MNRPKPALRVELLFYLTFLAAFAILVGVGTSQFALAIAPERGVFLVVVFVALEVGIFVLYGRSLVNRLVLRPLSRIMDTADAVADGDLAARAPDADTRDFATLAERGKAAAKQFQEVADKYSMVGPGKVARYLHASAMMQAGDSAAAESEFKSVASSSDNDIAALAKMALASIYVGSNRQAEAVKLYKELADHPSATVSKSTAQLDLAEIYEKTDPQQATTIYQQLQKDDPRSPAAQVAARKLFHPK